MLINSIDDLLSISIILLAGTIIGIICLISINCIIGMVTIVSSVVGGISIALIISNSVIASILTSSSYYIVTRIIGVSLVLSLTSVRNNVER